MYIRQVERLTLKSITKQTVGRSFSQPHWLWGPQTYHMIEYC